MLSNLTGWHALLILAAVLLIFGAAKLPALARSVGQSVRILKAETKSGTDATASGTADDAPAPAPVAVLTPAPAGEPVATTARTAS